MKSTRIFLGFLLLHVAVVQVEGQKPTCNHPAGTWKGEGNSSISIISVDSSTGEIKGIYQVSLSGKDLSMPLSGWLTVSQPAGDQTHSSAIVLSSGIAPNGFIVSWTGYCRSEAGSTSIHVLPQRVQAASELNQPVTDTMVFVPDLSAEAVHPLALASEESASSKTLVGNASCPLEGEDKNGNPPKAKMIALNLLKNRRTSPHSANVNTQVTLAKMLNSQDNPKLFDEHNGATITGVLFDVRQEKKESCNCNSDNPNDWDFHIYIGNASARSIFDCAVIEMTPYSRSIHPEWTLKFVQGLKGKQVQVTGWLLFDFEHTGQSFETNPSTGAPNRHTVWEIHPVTALSIKPN